MNSPASVTPVRTVLLWSFAAAVLLLAVRFGLVILNPLQTQWLPRMGGDIAAHYIGWFFYHHSPWTVPFGTIAHYAWPLATNVGYTDSIPLLAIPLRVLLGWVQAPFQYFGLWYLACYALGVYFAWRLLETAGVRDRMILLAGSVMSGLTPFLLARWGHDALCAHWLILAIWLQDLRARQGFTPSPVAVLALTGISAAIHPYLTLMIFVLSLPVWWQYWQQKQTHWRHRTAVLAGILGGIYLLWALIGYFQVDSDDARTGGFGEYSANLLTFFNPLAHSLFLPSLPQAHPNQYEGYAYLGIGLLLLIAAGLALYRTRFLPAYSSYKGWYVALAGLTLFALSHQWTAGGLYLTQFPHSDPFTGMFRSSGRFIWPAAYALSVLAIVRMAKAGWKPLALRALVLTALILQVADMYPLWKKDERMNRHFLVYPEASRWDSLLQTATHLLVYPPYERKLVHHDDYLTLSLLAAPYRIPVTTGYLSRYDTDARYALQAEIDRIVETGDFCRFPQGVLVTNDNYLEPLSRHLEAGRIHVWQWDGYQVVVPAGFRTRDQAPLPVVGRVTDIRLAEGLHGFLERHAARTILLAIYDEGTENLCPAAREWLASAGSGVGRLAYRDSWLAIIHEGRIVREAIGHDALRWDMAAGASWGAFTAPVPLRMQSGGMDSGAEALLDVAGHPHADRSRGIQVVVMDDAGQVVETAVFDTYQDCYARLR